MLKRFWMIVSAAWALLCLWGVRTAMKGAAQDVYLALAPFVLCSLLARAARFVVTGSVLKLRRAGPYRRPCLDRIQTGPPRESHSLRYVGGKNWRTASY